MKIPKQLAAIYQPHFERLLPANLSTAKNEAGDYANKGTQRLWLGYMLDKPRTAAHFIIARMHGDGKPRFSHTPKIHNTMKALDAELLRLTEEVPNQVFAAYMMLRRSATIAEVTEESKEYIQYDRSRFYIVTDPNPHNKFKPRYVTDDFDELVLPKHCMVFYHGEIQPGFFVKNVIPFKRIERFCKPAEAHESPDHPTQKRES